MFRTVPTVGTSDDHRHVYLAHHPIWSRSRSPLRRGQRQRTEAQHGGSAEQDAERERLTRALDELGRRETAVTEAQIEARMNSRPSEVYDRMLADVAKQRDKAQAV
jgi:hypothetical protein